MLDNQAYIVEQTGIIRKATETIRDIFPNDLTYLWDQLSPFICQIEESAQAIRRLTKDS